MRRKKDKEHMGESSPIYSQYDRSALRVSLEVLNPWKSEAGLRSWKLEAGLPSWKLEA